MSTCLGKLWQLLVFVLEILGHPYLHRWLTLALSCFEQNLLSLWQSHRNYFLVSLLRLRIITLILHLHLGCYRWMHVFFFGVLLYFSIVADH